ncbi:MAG: TIGR00725 family protein [Candidatus Eisenbacteria bacterium]|nr:TIGR00725 family protein [Candidatus Latescibacterota bacterium]MBD3303298.1 TIGR00725 family protein [Candidatus Eisenbacteria bacterium]
MSGPVRSSRRAPVILVSGGSVATPEEQALAVETGRRIADAGAVLITGGGAGVMEAASRGAREAGGIVLAVLPGSDAAESPPNAYVQHAVFTGMRDARNSILVRTADAVISIGGAWGTLSEIALARKIGRPVVLLASWRITPPRPLPGDVPQRAESSEEAVRLALAAGGVS